jgi:recombination protein RecA
MPTPGNTKTSKASKKNEDTAALGRIDNFLKGVSKDIGTDEDMRIASVIPEIEKISTGSLLLDKVLGGGVARGVVVEIFGQEGSGKTTLSLLMIAEAQKKYKDALFVYLDLECSLTDSLLKITGVVKERLLIIHPTSGEATFEYIRSVILNGDRENVMVPIVVVDSVAAMVPMEEARGGMGNQQIGLQARLLSKGLRMIVKLLKAHGTTVVFINQVRSKVGVYYGNPEVTAGGKALPFYSSVRMRVKKVRMPEQSMADAPETGSVAHIMQISIKKNKSAPLVEPVQLELLHGVGFDKVNELVMIAKKRGIIIARGSWLLYGKTSLGQGVKNCRQYLLDNPAMLTDVAKETFGQDFNVEQLA